MKDLDFSSKVLYVRHGTTEYNKILQKDPKNKQFYRTCEDYLDCPLSDEGKKEALGLKSLLKGINIKYVFVSPMLRCLETLEIALNGNCDAEIFIHPFLTEIVSACHDIPTKIKNKKQNYHENSELKFSWKFFDQHFPNDQEYFYFNYIDNPKHSLEKEIEFKTNYRKGMISELLNELCTGNDRPESLNYLYKRCMKFKCFLKDFLDKNELKENEKVLVVTHSAVIRLTSSKLAEKLSIVKDYPEDSYQAKNCELIPLSI